jgi:hypothetical protein
MLRPKQNLDLLRAGYRPFSKEQWLIGELSRTMHDSMLTCAEAFRALKAVVATAIISAAQWEKQLALIRSWDKERKDAQQT